MKKAVFFVVFRLVVMVLGIFVMAYIARLVPPASFGMYSLFFSFFSILSIPMQHAAPTYLIKNYRGGGGRDASVDKVLSFFLLCVGLVALVSLVLTVLFDVSWMFSVLFIVSYFLFGLNVGIRGGVVTALYKPEMAGALEAFFRNLVMFLVAYLVLGASSSYFDVFTAYSVSVIASFVICFFVTNKLLSLETLISFRFSLLKNNELKVFLTFALLGGVFVINANLDQVLIGFVLGVESVAIYKISVLSATAVSFIFSSLSLIAGPYFSKGDEDLTKRKGRGLAKLCFLMTAFSLLIYAVTGRYLIDLFIGDFYINSYVPGLFLILSLAINSLLGFSGLYLNLNGEEGFVLKVAVLSVFLNCILNMILIPLFSVNGAALATMISSFIWKILLLVKMQKKTGFGISVFSKGQ